MPRMINSTHKCYESCSLIPYCDRVEICQRCGLGRSLLAGRAPELQDYVPHNANARTTKTAYLTWVFNRYLRETVPGSLLDIGCADGILLDVAAANGWRVAGLDSHANDECQHTIITARFLEHDFNEHFDALTFIHSFEHMDDPRATLLKCCSLLKQDGRLLIVVPNFGGLWAQAMGQEWQWLNPDDHRYHYTRNAIARLLKQTGFRIDASRTYSGFAPSLPQMILSAKRVLDWPGLRWWPASAALFRLSSLAGVVCNPGADFAGQGAELQVLARPV
jgi:SAM-dependent methyltransferase